MKLRKPLAILLVLALSLGVAPITGASGAIEGQSTTFQSEGTVTPEMMRAGSSEPPSNNWKPDANGKFPDKQIETIKVKVTNIYDIQVNPYGMTIKVPGTDNTSTNSIVTAPIIIENRSGVQMDVTATATVTAEGDVTFESEPPEPYIPSQFDDPEKIPSEERVFLFMLMTTKVQNQTPNWSTVWSMGSDDNGNPVWPRDEAYKEEKKKFTPNVITRDGGSGQINVTMDKGTETDPSFAALQIFGQTNKPLSIPSPPNYAAWHRGNGFEVKLVLSFMPQQGYTVTFDAMDVLWSKGRKLLYPVTILIHDNDNQDNSSSKEPLKLTFDKGLLNNPQEVSAQENLTFTVKTTDEPKGTFYMIRDIILIRENGEEETVFRWENDDPKIAEYTCTINASKINAGENLNVKVILNSVTVN